MTEIILLGTFHFPGKFDIFSKEIQSQVEDFTEKLALLKPNKIAVEFPYIMQDELDNLYELTTVDLLEKNTVINSIHRWGHDEAFESGNEIVQIGFRLGRKIGCKRVYGIDEEIELSDELIEKISKFIDLNNFQNELFNMVKSANSIEESYVIHNSEAYNILDHSIYQKIRELKMENGEGERLYSQWAERNSRIFSNISSISEDGDRVLVLIGSAHLMLLKELIEASDYMTLVKI